MARGLAAGGLAAQELTYADLRDASAHPALFLDAMVSAGVAVAGHRIRIFKAVGSQ